MLKLEKLAILQATHRSRNFTRWFIHLGGVGLIPLGILDASVIPLPGSMDVVTILLAAHETRWWIYYAFMATVGSVLGAYLTYRLAQHQGGNRLARRFSRRTMKKVEALFERWGVAAIVIPAVLPPPMPMVPFVLAAGAMKYSWRKFLAALTFGRAIRFGILAYLGARYGRHILRMFSKYEYPVLFVTIGLVSIAVIAELVRWGMRRSEARA
ncbi:MAG: VTT domain-containing protein [Candidatus Acidiferrales bacterium]